MLIKEGERKLSYLLITFFDWNNLYNQLYFFIV